MKIGYARVSTEEQNLDLQRHALNEAGCHRIFEDKGISGAARGRPGLHKALAFLSEGDVFVVWRLDRLGRSLPHLIEVVQSIGDRGIGFQSLNEEINTTSASGRFIFHIMGALAEFERSLISERTKAGMRAAKVRGEAVGRPHKLSDRQIAQAKKVIEQGEESVPSMARLLNVSSPTLYRALRERS